MMICIHQPDFLPWLGFFSKIIHSDMFVVGDHVQYRNKGFQNRNRIKTPNGAQWLSVPIIHDWGQAINKVQILDREQNGIFWSNLHLRTLQVNYGKAPYYDNYIGTFEKIYKRGHKLLADINMEFLKAVFEILGIDVQMKKTSEMNLTKSKTELIVEICQTLGADAYLSGLKGAEYMDMDLLEKNRIKIVYNHYEHPTYAQQYTKLGFLSNLSVIDLIFNEGPKSPEIIKSGFREFQSNVASPDGNVV